jgi:hypothetical protein
MYLKPSAGGLLAIAGAAAVPTASPELRVARLMLEITGSGFILYCAAAAGLCVAGCWLRWRERAGRRRGVAETT